MLETERETTAPKIVEMLNACIEACIDGQRGYSAAAADIEDPALQRMFEKYSVERARFVDALRDCAESFGEHPKAHGTARAAAHRGFLHARTVFEGDKEIALLVECERGELGAIAAYDRAFAKTPLDTLPPDVRALLVGQRAAIRTAYDKLTQEDVARRRTH